MPEDGGRLAGVLGRGGVGGGQVAVDVCGGGVGGVACIRRSPVDEEDVVAVREQALDEAVSGAQVPDVALVDQAGDEQHCGPVTVDAGPVAAHRCPVLPPYDQVRGASGARPVQPGRQAQAVDGAAGVAVHPLPQTGQRAGDRLVHDVPVPVRSASMDCCSCRS